MKNISQRMPSDPPGSPKLGPRCPSRVVVAVPDPCVLGKPRDGEKGWPWAPKFPSTAPIIPIPTAITPAALCQPQLPLLQGEIKHDEEDHSQNTYREEHKATLLGKAAAEELEWRACGRVLMPPGLPGRCLWGHQWLGANPKPAALAVAAVMRPRRHGVHHHFQEFRGLHGHLVEVLEDLKHQVVQDPLYVLLAETGLLQRGAGAAPAALPEDSHPHLAPAHVEEDVHLG